MLAKWYDSFTLTFRNYILKHIFEDTAKKRERREKNTHNLTETHQKKSINLEKKNAVFQRRVYKIKNVTNELLLTIKRKNE